MTTVDQPTVAKGKGKSKNKNRLPQALMAGSKLLVEKFGDTLAIDGPLPFEHEGEILAAARAYVETLTDAQLGIIVGCWTAKRNRPSIGELVGGSFTKLQEFWHGPKWLRTLATYVVIGAAVEYTNRVKRRETAPNAIAA